MSLLLEVRDPPIPESYQALFPHLLAPVLWERPGNIPPLVRLLQAFIEKVPITYVRILVRKIIK